MNEIETTKIIESGRPLIGLMEQFGSGLDALQFYAGEMARRYRPAAVGKQCCCCGRNPVSRVQMFCWSAFVNPRFAFTRRNALELLIGHLGVTLRHTVVGFETFHGLCESCASKAKRNRIYSVVVKSISFFLLLVCIGLVLFSGGGAVMFKSDPKDRVEFLVGFFIGVIGLTASIFAHGWERRLRIPKYFQTIGRKPFLLEKVVDCNAGNS